MAQEPPPGGCVLVVDDDDALRTLVVTALRRRCAAWTFLQARDGRDAQSVLQQNAVDVVVTDINMPNLSGLELLKWARSTVPDPIWVIHSGLETFAAAAEALSLGAFAFLPKSPASFRLLPATVSNAFDKRRLLADRRRLTEELRASNEALRDKVTTLERVLGLMHQQSRVIEADLHRARRIQRALLPDCAPELSGWCFRSLYRPSQQVGGDLYNIVYLPPRHLVVYVADAAGHGVAAAMLSVLFKHHVDLAGPRGEPIPPAVALGRVNAALYSECRDHGLFLTAAYAVLDLETRHVTMALAGHPDVLVRRGASELTHVAATGPAIGLKSDAVYGEAQLDLDTGDRLLMVTDGAFDALGSAEVVARHFAAEDTEGLFAALGETMSDQRPDDITAVVVAVDTLPSRLDNLDDGSAAGSAGGRSRLATFSQDGQLLVGATDQVVVVALRGRCTWSIANALMSIGREALDQSSALALDLTSCCYLDSTALGTVHELVLLGDARERTVRLHRADQVRPLFIELGMEAALAHCTDVAAPRPARLEPVTTNGPDVDARRERVLQAHVALAAIGEANQQEFSGLIAGLRAELGATPENAPPKHQPPDDPS